ncbi:MAG: CapA family protein [Clostridia bacterium]|nr:CapA family protein [Clostridia bacterium]
MGSARVRFTRGTVIAMIAAAALLLVSAFFLLMVYGGKPESVSLPGREETAPEAEPVQTPSEDRGETPLPALTATPRPETTAGPERSSFTIAAAGTVNVPRSIREFAQDTGHYDFSTLFLGLGSTLSDADLSLATMETLADSTQAYDTVNAPPEVLDALRTLGLDALSLGTEHVLDKGYEGLDHTLSEFVSRGLDALGIRGGDGLPGTMIGIQGIRVALLGYTYGLDEEGAAQTNKDARGFAALLEKERIAADIAAARAAGAEVVILMPHWGIKNRTDTPESVRQLAGELAQAGADIILGAHSNVVHEIERLEVTRADGRTYETLICYSLGSLLNDSRAPENSAGVILRLELAYDREERRTVIGEPEIIPLYISRQEEEGRPFWRIVEAENEASLTGLTAAERSAAAQASAIVREALYGEDLP